MPSGNARLVVEVVATSAQFQADLGKAAAIAAAQAKRIEASIEGLKGKFASIGKTFIASLAGAFTVDAILSWGKEVVSAAADLQDLSRETGSSVESLSRLNNIATISGASFTEFRTIMDRLAAGLNGSEELSTKTADALKFLGVSTKDPAQAIEEIAVKLDKFSDGAGKAALARDLFGRQGVQFLSVLHQIVEQGDVAATVTSKQAAEAEKLQETYRRLTVESTRFKDVLLSDVVPSITRMIVELNEGRRIAGGFLNAILEFGTINPFKSITENLAGFRQELERLENIKAKGGIDLHRPFDNVDSEIARRKRQLEFLKLQQRLSIDTSENPANFDARDIRARTKPPLPYVSSGNTKVAQGIVDDPSRKILEGELRSLEAFLAQEKDALAARASYLQSYFGHGDISLETYFAGRRAGFADDLNVTLTTIDKEIAAERAYIQTHAKNDSDRQDHENRIETLQARRIKAQQDASRQSVELWFDERSAVEAYQRSIESVEADLLDLQGKTAAAFAVRQKGQNLSLRNQFTAAGDTVSNKRLDEIENLRNAQARLNEMQNGYNLAVTELGTIQGHVDVQLQRGAITELDSINQRAEAASRYAAGLRPVVEAYEAIARASGNTADIVHAQQLRLELERLSAQADELRKKFQDVFVGAFTDNLTALVTGTKSLKQAVKDFEKSVVQSISNIASKNIGEYLFGKEGPLGGISDLLGGLFGGGGKAKAPDLTGGAGLSAAGTTLTSSGTVLTSAGTALTTSGTTLTTSGTTLTSAGTTLTSAGTLLTSAAASLEAAAATLGASSASSAAGGIGKLFGPGAIDVGDNFAGGIPFFANGTNAAPGGLAVVGEQGPELVYLPKGAQVIPNERIGKLASGTDNWRGGMTWVGERGPELVNQRGTQVIPNDLLRMRGTDSHPPASNRITNMSVTTNVSIAGNASTKTANQIGLEAGRRVRYAVQRNG